MKKLKLYFSLAFFFLALGVFAQQKELPPPGGTPKDFKVPPRREFQLDNGMKVVMIQYGILPKVAVNLTVKTGQINEDDGEAGLTELLTSLMEEGTANRTARELAEGFARMGGQLNIGSGFHTTSISATVLSDRAQQCVELIGEVALQPAFPEGEVDRLKNDLKRSYSVSRANPQVQASDAFFATFYGSHPYGRPTPSDAEVESLTIDKVKAFYDREFGAQRSTLYIVGKFEEKKVEEAVRRVFSAWKKGNPVDYPVAEAVISEEIKLLDRKGSPQATIFMGLPVPDPTSPDFTALDVMDDLLGGSFSSRITSNIREDKGYTYSPYSTVNNRYKSAIWFEQADVTIEQTGNALQEVYKEIDRLRKEAPAAVELDGIKNYKAGQFVLQNSSPGGIIGQLIFMDLHGLDDSYLNKRIENIYAVTPESVREVAEKYLDPEKMAIIVVGDKGSTAPQIEAYKKADKAFRRIPD